MRMIRGSRDAHRSIIDRVASRDPPSTQICSTSKLACCSVTEASVRSIVAAAFRLTVTIESRGSMSGLLNRTCECRLMHNMRFTQDLALMRSPNFEFQSKFATFPLALLPADALAADARLPRHHGRRADLCVSGVRETPSTARGRSVSAKHLAGSIHHCFRRCMGGCIGLLGLENAARLLTLIFTLWFLAAAWSFARAVADRDAAWLAVAFLLIVAGDYGGSGVFRILDPFLTARLPAEALIHYRACLPRPWDEAAQLWPWRWEHCLIHPLIALPGLLLVVCLWLPLRVSVLGAIGGVFATLAIAVVSAHLPTVRAYFDRHGCSVVGRGTGTLAIPIFATLVDS